MCFHSLWYWATQRIVYKLPTFGGIEAYVPLSKRSSLRDLMATTAIDGIAFLHTVVTFHQTLVSNPVFRISNLFQTVAQPSLWTRSQYAMECVIYTSSTLKMLWTPSAKPMREFVGHHLLAILLLVSSYYMRLTNVGVMVITITNSTNLFFDYFKFGLLTKDIKTKWSSSVLFWCIFYIFRVHLFSQSIILPIAENISTVPLYITLFFGPFLCGLYGFQLWWFYRLTRLTFRNTKQWVDSVLNLSTTETLIQNDLGQMMDFLKTIETRIHQHVHSHTIRLSSEDTDSDNNNRERLIESDTNSDSGADVDEDNEPATIQDYCEKMLSEKTLSEISEMADKIMDEALGQWRAVMLKQLNYMETKTNSEITPAPITLDTASTVVDTEEDIPTISETDKKND